MQTHQIGSTLEAENLLRASGWTQCPRSRSALTSLPGRACWCLHQDDPFSPDVFVTDYGYVLEVPHGNLCPPSVLRFPRRPGEPGFTRAFERLSLYLEVGDFWAATGGE